MKKIYIWTSLIILLGVIIILFTNQNNESENLESKNIKLKEGDHGLISKDKAFKKFQPGEGGANKQVMELDMTLQEKSLNGKTKYIFTIKNNTETNQSLNFGTSQRYDYEVIDSSRKVVYHYSDGKSFMQVLKTITLEPGEELEYELNLPKLKPGSYQLSAVLAADGFNLKRETIDLMIK